MYYDKILNHNSKTSIEGLVRVDFEGHAGYYYYFLQPTLTLKQKIVSATVIEIKHTFNVGKRTNGFNDYNYLLSFN